jgi:serine/threonine protein kinase
MKDNLQDLIQHTHSLGIDLIKVTGTETETQISAIAEDKSVIVNGTLNSPVAEFIGVFGMPNLGKLKTILGFDDYGDDSKINVTRVNKDGVDVPEYIHFETKAGDFVNDYRLMSKAIADEKGERCYLISQRIEASQTLSQYLQQNGKMTASQVREILNQTLQTLEFLHSQKIRFPSNQVKQGIAHGNINLDSVLIKSTSNQQFYIYLCDLAIWENLFIPPAIVQPALAQQERDLESLGLVAFYLLAGRTSDYASNQPLDPKDNQQWSTTDVHLKQFIEQLIGLSTPFSNAEAARQALMQLPKEGQANHLSPSSEDEPAKPDLLCRQSEQLR